MDNKYQQIISYIQSELAADHLKPGFRLPSIRETADRFNCNKATVIRAYQEMEQNHLLYSVPKSGFYVVDKKSADKKLSGKNLIDFSAAAPDSTIFPYRDFQHCLNQAIDNYKEDLFSYLYAPGLPSLCQTLAHFLQDYQIYTSPENIFVTAGSQQALHILANMPFPNGKNHVLLEQPTYFLMERCCQVSNVTTIGIERNREGIDLEELERIFSSGNIKFFYIIPRFHNPLGTSYSNGMKKQILQLAQKYNVYIVEDDYLADLELDSKVDPIYAFDTSSRVIYIRTFSKTLMPGLRLGIAVLPRLLLNTFREYKNCADLSTSILSQGALEIYIKSGMFVSHLKKIKSLYQERMADLKKACQTYLPGEINPIIPQTGFFTCLELPFKAMHLVNGLQNQNIRVVNLENTFLADFRRDNIIRISVCKTNQAQIEEGISIIGKVMNSFLEKHPDSEQGYFNPFL